MTQTPRAEQRQTGDALSQIAARTGFSEDAVGVMAQALRRGGGSMAQFDHPEFGGFGQGSSGGMLMIGDMFNDGLKARVRGLLEALSGARDAGLLPEPAAGETGSFGGTWWPEGLGRPASTGAQNGRRYAVFPDSRRLAIETDGKVTLYDTAEHRIGGVSQAQGGTASLRLSSDRGDVDLGRLAVVDENSSRAVEAEEATLATEETAPAPATPAFTARPEEAPAPIAPSPVVEKGPVVEKASSAEKAPAFERAPAPAGPGSEAVAPEAGGFRAGDPIATIRHLASLRDEGILTEAEFAAKKQELLARL